MSTIKGLYYYCYYDGDDLPYVRAYATLGEALANFLSELAGFADKPMDLEDVEEARSEGFYRKDDGSFIAWGRFNEDGIIDKLERRMAKDRGEEFSCQK